MLDPRIVEARRNPRRTHKVCCVCRIDKPLEEYHLGGSVVDGHAAACKPCAIDRVHRFYDSMQEQPPALSKWCTACQRTLPSSSFSLNRYRPTGLQGHCKDCHQQLARGVKVVEIRQRLGKPLDRTRITQAYPKVTS